MATPTVTNLLSDVQTAIPSRRLIQLTNPENPSATTIDTTILKRACEDAAIYFEVKAAKNYDDTNRLHRTVALLGVTAYLKQYEKGSSSEVRSLFERFDDMLKTVNDARSFRIKTKAKTDDEDNDSFTSFFFDHYKPN